MNAYKNWSNYYDRKVANPQAVFLEFYDEDLESRASIGEDKFKITYEEVRAGKTRALEKWLRRDLECCVCYEGNSPFLPCCDVSLCLRCYVKMVCQGEDKCPCCRTEKVLQMPTAIYVGEAFR